MNTEQKLTKIREKCVARIEYAKSNVTDLYGGAAIAAWESTIAAIDLLTNDGTDYARYEPELKKLIAPWEGLL